MIGLALAQGLRAAGLAWNPLPGDRFVVPDRGMDEEVFVISNMVVEVQDVPTGQIIGFNGTTEWAMDDVELEEALWLPREDQLRELLGGTLRALRRAEAGWAVDVTLLGEDRTFSAPTPEDAYAAALLHLLAAATT
jgi:hypothetical protein